MVGGAAHWEVRFYPRGGRRMRRLRHRVLIPCGGVRFFICGQIHFCFLHPGAKRFLCLNLFLGIEFYYIFYSWEYNI